MPIYAYLGQLGSAMTQQVSDVPRIWRRKKVEAETGLARSSIYAMMKAGKFPRQISLGPRSVGWIGLEVLEWISQRIEQSREGEPTSPRRKHGKIEHENAV